MARNHEEDQKSELEALESIYYNELEGWLFEITHAEHDLIDFSGNFSART